MEEEFDSNIENYLNIISNCIQNIQVETNELQYLVYSFIPTMNNNLANINNNISQIANQVVTTNGLNNKILHYESDPNYDIGSIITGFKAAASFLGILGSIVVLIKAIGNHGISDFFKSLKNIRSSFIKSLESLIEKLKAFNRRNDSNSDTENKEEENNNSKENEEKEFGDGTVEGSKKIICECHCDCNCNGNNASGAGEKEDEDNEIPNVPSGGGGKLSETIGETVDSLDSAMLATREFANTFDGTLLKVYLYAKGIAPKIGETISTPITKSLSSVEVALAKFNKDSKVQFNNFAINANSENGKILEGYILLNKNILNNATKFNKEFIKTNNGFYSKLGKDLKTQLDGVIAIINKGNNEILQGNNLLNKGILNNNVKSNKELLKNYNSFYSKLSKDLETQSNGIVAIIEKGNGKILLENNALDKDLFNNTAKSNKNILNNYNSFYSELEKNTNKGLSGIPSIFRMMENTLESIVSKGGKNLNSDNSGALNLYNGNTKSKLNDIISDWRGSTNTIYGIVEGLGKNIVRDSSNTMSTASSAIKRGLNDIKSIINFGGRTINGVVNDTGNNSVRSVNGSTGSISSLIGEFKNSILGKIGGLATGITGVIVANSPNWASSFSSALNSISNDVGSWVSGIESTFERVSNYISGMFSRFKERLGSEENYSWINERFHQLSINDDSANGEIMDAFIVKNISESTWDHSRLRKTGSSEIFGGNGDKGVNVVINSPKALNPFEIRRQLEQTSRNMANGFY